MLLEPEVGMMVALASFVPYPLILVGFGISSFASCFQLPAPNAFLGHSLLRSPSSEGSHSVSPATVRGKHVPLVINDNYRAPSTRQGSPSTLMARKAKRLILADECRNQLLEGIEAVAGAVRVTLGPRGRNVLLEKEYGPPMIVNDGVTIARNIELKSRAHNAGAKLVQEVASTSDEWAGDGTSSTTILTAEIARQGVDHVNKGHNPIPLQRGIQRAAKVMMEEVKRLAKPVDGMNDLLNIATVATSGNVAMGQVIAKSFDKLGRHAAIVLEDNPALEDTLEFTEGYTFERGYSSPYFLVGEDRDIIEWQSPSILVCDYKIETAQSILPILEHFVRTKAPLVLIAEDFGPEVLQTCIINRMRQLLKVVTIRAPSFGERRKEYLRDIAVATNAQLISRDLGLPLEDATATHVGNAASIVVRKDRTSILTRPEYQPSIKDRVAQLQKELEVSTSKFDREKLGERIAALSGGIARIMIGASTETEQKEKRLRYEDSINAVRAALETGYVPGGGVTYLALSTDEFYNKIVADIEAAAKAEMTCDGDDPVGAAAEVVDEMEGEIELQKAGAKIVVDSMKSITKQIADNAGVNGNKVVRAILTSGKPFGFGWNAKTNKFGDMISQGVIDPAKVIISAIEHSTSVAGLVLTTEGMMVEEEEPEKHSRDVPDMPMA
ncbi:chaperonin cpn60, putative [Toxoplasma gondii ME49]|uniref:Chaperonin cpn60, putative n=2 Tax=Toxoplasma gondii TaxID=5811 RepID=A0A125YM67_TOXGM|nr:chaperonin cpn60, putative [Toxoplasma gondii ME49]EPT30689.1 chaperonin cpn60, putative [Toxoplasma gondii ME49]ESS31435.1 putative chaperonin cpn60 [Toxoplasma gondii VEG]CEL73404.1 TPA: TCP-1/cpn60 chaperonin family protein, putative [Toxoplasma gondii VEG]|eukprot:XP_002366679.1 chaperonin cpn60, putative [Toxoplasma gondii ME49]